MIYRLRMITPEKHGLGRRIKKLFLSAGAKVLSLGAVREMRGMSETEARFTAPDPAICQEAVAALEQIPGVAILELRSEGAPEVQGRSSPPLHGGPIGTASEKPGTQSHV